MAMEAIAAVEEAEAAANSRKAEAAQQAKQLIAADSERIRSETKAELDALRSRAETRLGDAAEKIVERIVNG